MSAQTAGQWFGLVLMTVTIGAIGFGLLQIILSIRDYFRRREFYVEAARTIGERIARNFPAPPANLTLVGRVVDEWGDVRKYGQPPRPELMMDSPPCEPMVRGSGFPPMAGTFRRGEYPRAIVTSSRTGGKSEAQRLALLHADTLSTPYNLRPYLFGGSSLDSMAVGLIIRQATKTSRPPGEIALGVALDLERDFLDGDRPSLTEPRGIFSQ